MEAAWFYELDGAQQGPSSLAELREAVLQRRIGRHSLVWRAGMEQWQPLESVDGLQELLEVAPPPLPLPPSPPPLPARHQASTASPASPTAPPRERERRAAGSPPAAEDPAFDASEATTSPSDPRPPQAGKKKAVLLAGLGKVVDWIGSNAVGWLKDHFFGRSPIVRTAISLAVTSISVTAVYLYAQRDPEPPPSLPLATGTVQIDANPWGEVQWIRDAEGATMPLGDIKTTPFRISLPTGTYRARVSYPPTEAARECDLAVGADETATCWLDLAPMNAKTYFERIGW